MMTDQELQTKELIDWCMERAAEHPFDMPDDDYEDQEYKPATPTPSTGWAHTAARAVVALMEQETRLSIEMHGWSEAERVQFLGQMRLIIEDAHARQPF
jgi:hypothetical protein